MDDRLPFMIEAEQRFRDKLGDELFNILEELTKDSEPIYPDKKEKDDGTISK